MLERSADRRLLANDTRRNGMFRAGIGGLRHVATELGKVDQVCGELRSLSNEELNEVLGFIAEIKSRRREGESKPKAGTVEALLSHTNRWSFDEGEREPLLAAVRRIREGESA